MGSGPYLRSRPDPPADDEMATRPTRVADQPPAERRFRDASRIAISSSVRAARRRRVAALLAARRHAGSCSLLAFSGTTGASTTYSHLLLPSQGLRKALTLAPIIEGAQRATHEWQSRRGRFSRYRRMGFADLGSTTVGRPPSNGRSRSVRQVGAPNDVAVQSDAQLLRPGPASPVPVHVLGHVRNFPARDSKT